MLAVVLTYPLIRFLNSRIGPDLGDPLLSTSILWWNAHAIPLTGRWWNGFAFYPSTGMLAFSDHRLGLSLIASPLQWLGASPVAAYNIVFLLTFPLCAMGGHLLGYTLTKRHDAAAICGLSFGFNPFRVAHLSHLELLAGFGIPIALAALHVYLDDRRTRWLVLYGAALLLQALLSSYYVMFLGVLVVLWIAWFVRDVRTAAVIAAATAVPAIVVLPIAIEYFRIHAAYGFSRSLNEITSLSADAVSYLIAPARDRLWGFTASLARGVDLGPFPAERQLFPGLTIVILAAFGAAMALRARATHRTRLTFYLVATLLLVLCSFGPRPSVLGHTIVSTGPYAWLMALPGFAKTLRVPARFAMAALLTLAAAASLAFDGLQLSATARRRLVVLVLAGIAADAAWRFETIPVPRAWRPPDYDFGAVVELPMNEAADFAAMYRATRHGHPVVNGHSGFLPPSYRALEASLMSGDTAMLNALPGSKPLLVVIDNVADADLRWAKMIAADPRATPRGEDGRWSFFTIEPGF